jgi:hypothetical protein
MALDGVISALTQMNNRFIPNPPVEKDKDLVVFSKTESGELVFHYGVQTHGFTEDDVSLSDERPDPDAKKYKFYGKISKPAYEKARKELLETGHCFVEGDNCTFDIKRFNGFYEVDFKSEVNRIDFPRGSLDGFL